MAKRRCSTENLYGNNEQFWESVESGEKTSFNGRPSEFFALYLRAFRQKGNDVTISRHFLVEQLDDVFQLLGPRSGINMRMQEIQQIGMSQEVAGCETHVKFVATVKIEARYKSFGADRTITLPITLILLHPTGEEGADHGYISPRRAEEWCYDFEIGFESLIDQLDNNDRIQDEVIATSRDSAMSVVAPGLRRPLQGGKTGSKK